MKRTRWEGNEIILTNDVEDNGDNMLNNIDEAFGIIGATTIVKGYEVAQTVVPSMNIVIPAGIAFDVLEDMLMVNLEDKNITVSSSDPALDRRDTVQMKREEVEQALETRSFKNPTTGIVTQSSMDTEKEYTVQIEVKPGTPGSASAPTIDAGWVKLAEILVPAASITVITSNIYNIDAISIGLNNTNWTSNVASIYQNGTISEIQKSIYDYSQAFETEILTVNGNITQTAGVTSLKATTIADSLIITGIADFQIAGIDLLKPVTILDVGHTDQGILDFNRGSGTYGADIYTDYRLINESGVFKIYNNNTTDGQKTLGIFSTSEIQFNNTTIIGSGINNTVDLLQVGSNTDISASIGRARMGLVTGKSGAFYIGHYDFFNATDYNFLIDNISNTIVNSKSGRQVVIRNADNNVATFSSSEISLLKPVTIQEDTFVLQKFDRTANVAVSNVFGLAVSLSNTLSILDVTTANTVLASFSPSAISLLKPVTISGAGSTPFTIDGGAGALSTSIKNSGLGSNNTISQRQFNATNSGRVETLLGQAQYTNFWNIGLESDGVYTIATNVAGNMSSGILLQMTASLIKLLKPVTVGSGVDLIALDNINHVINMGYGASNYLRGSTAGGALNFITSGRAISNANSSLQLTASGRVVVGLGATDNTVDAFQVAGSIYASGGINTGYGTNNVVPEDVYFDRTSITSDKILPAISIKETAHISYNVTSGVNIDFRLPATGTYSYTFVADGSSGIFVGSGASEAGNFIVATIGSGDQISITYRRLT